MKNSFKFAFVSLFALLTIACGEQKVSEDKYTILEGVSVAQPDVVEIFSLGCSHCRNLEKVLTQVEENSEISIHKTHVVFNESTLSYAYLYYAAEIQFEENKGDFAQFTRDLFALIQEEFQKVTIEKKRALLSQLFTQYKLIEPQDLTEAHHAKINQLATNSKQLGSEIKLSGVPAILVKGKYLLNMQKHKSSDDLIKTINYLSQL